jgi:c(7)-type cytochrome triheme protein
MNQSVFRLAAVLLSMLCGQVNAAGPPDGKAIYDRTCVACHGTGATGAPKMGDAAAWAPRIKAGSKALMASAINGKGVMPAKGGNASLSNAEVQAAVSYIVSQSSAGAKTAGAATPAPAGAPVVAVVAAAGGGEANGKAIYDSTCGACHATGAAGAPKTGDAAAWAPRIKGGQATLVASAIKGKGAMPAKGGNAKLTDAEIQAAVKYIVSQSASGAKSAEAPAQPAAAAPAVAVATAGGGEANGKSIYDSTCGACHATGAAGAPKTGDAAAWAPRIKSGQAALVASATKGKGAMPAKGGNAKLTDAELQAAVKYMVSQSGAGAKSADAPANPTAAAAAPAADVTAKTAPVATPAATPGAASAPAPVEPPPAAATGGVNTFNRLMQPAAKRNLPPAEDGIHDPASAGTQSLQPPMAAFGALTKSNDGNRVDWVKSLTEEKINPRFDRIDPNAKPMVMDMNIVREVKGSMPDVVYPHKEHTQWLDCSNCHPAIFIPQKGANQISMAAILMGQKCGVCHGKVAFPVSDCRRCHSKAKTTAVKAPVKP